MDEWIKNSYYNEIKNNLKNYYNNKCSELNIKKEIILFYKSRNYQYNIDPIQPYYFDTFEKLNIFMQNNPLTIVTSNFYNSFKKKSYENNIPLDFSKRNNNINITLNGSSMDFKFKNNTIYSYNKNSLNIENDNIDNKEPIIESQINFLNNNNKLKQ